jgi:hypothetical protein
MAQVELRFFEDLGENKADIARVTELTVANVHYGQETVSPGDITLVVPVLDLGLSKSDANFELEISEGSDNWPRDAEGKLLVDLLAEEALQERAERISAALRKTFSHFSHNIFEVNGLATGWVQYKPGM